jgi:hypothetical protein
MMQTKAKDTPLVLKNTGLLISDAIFVDVSSVMRREKYEPSMCLAGSGMVACLAWLKHPCLCCMPAMKILLQVRLPCLLQSRLPVPL